MWVHSPIADGKKIFLIWSWFSKDGVVWRLREKCNSWLPFGYERRKKLFDFDDVFYEIYGVK